MPRDPFGGAMVTNVGMLGIPRGFAPIVTFTRCPIVIVVGSVEERPAVRDGQVVARPMFTLGAAMDHRIMDGFQAARLAAGIRLLLEEPAAWTSAPTSRGCEERTQPCYRGRGGRWGRRGSGDRDRGSDSDRRQGRYQGP